MLQTNSKKDTGRRESEQSKVRKRLKELEGGLLNDLERLDRSVIQEQEFALRNEARRRESAVLEARESKLSQWLEQVRTTGAQVERLPKAIGTFISDFQNMDIRWQKAQLQTKLKAAHIWTEGRIELEFRS